jgi:hypothetical protein
MLAAGSAFGQLSWVHQPTGIRGRNNPPIDIELGLTGPWVNVVHLDGGAIGSEDLLGLARQFPITDQNQLGHHYFPFPAPLASIPRTVRTELSSVLGPSNLAGPSGFLPPDRTALVLRSFDPNQFDSRLFLLDPSQNSVQSFPGVHFADFRPNGELVTFTDKDFPNTVDQFVLVAAGANSLDRAVVEINNGVLYHQTVFGSSWQPPVRIATGPVDESTVEFVFVGETPTIVYVNSQQQLVATHFDNKVNDFVSSILPGGTGPPQGMSITSRGHRAAVAWMAEDDNINQDVLFVAVKDFPDEAWEVHTVCQNCVSIGSPALDVILDASLNPVVSYIDRNSQEVIVAYDPPVAVPEPTSAVLFGIGAGLLLLLSGRFRRRNAAAVERAWR